MKMPKRYRKPEMRTKEIEVLECPRCGAVNTIDSRKCGYCGVIFDLE